MEPRRTCLLHLALLLLLSGAFEAYFLNHGSNPRDEGWPLYAAMGLHQGGTLYDEVFWVFPPGHVLPAWLGYALDPPGLVATRAIYGLFSVALCLALYVLGRRLMPPHFALLGALLLAVAAPRTHMIQAVFGYRYLVFSVLALLAFSQRLRSEDRRWMGVAGLATGVALFFRLTPAFAVAVGIGVGVLAAERAWRSWLRDGAWFALGLGAVLAPALAWFHASVGLPTLWYEVVHHPLAMLQALPVPELYWPLEWTWAEVTLSFVGVSFRLYGILYLAYLTWLGVGWLRAWRARRPFEQPLLLAVAVWGAVYYVRSLGRADEPHLDSAIPPVCLLLAHALSLGWHRVQARWPAARRPYVSRVVVAAAFLAWVGLLRVPSILEPWFDGKSGLPREVLRKAAKLRRWTAPGERVFDASALPLLQVLADRPGPGWRDVVMPGTFFDAEEERRFIERLEADPPVLVIWPLMVFDEMPERSLKRTAPALVAWIFQHYEYGAVEGSVAYLFPRGERPAGVGPTALRCRGDDCERTFEAPWLEPPAGTEPGPRASP